MPEEPTQVKVKRVEPLEGSSPFGVLWHRCKKAAFPILGGLILDCADLATFGPAGLYSGLFVGGTIGWLISDYYAYSKKGRAVFALIAGLYCAMPGTFFLPLATLSAVFGLTRKQKLTSDES